MKIFLVLSLVLAVFNATPSWSNFYRDSFTDERIQSFKTGWVVNEKLLAHRCFVKEWFSSDNFEAVAEHFNIEDEDDFKD